MKAFNKFLVIFGIIITLFIVGAWNFLQSKYVSTILSEYINKNLILNDNMHLSFTRVSGGFFPPRTILENVNFKVEDGIEVQMKDVSAAFSLISLLSSEVKFSTVSFEDGFVSIPKLEKSESDSEVSIYKTLKNVTSQLPFHINRIEVKNSDFFLKEKGINIPVNSLALSPYELSYDIVLDMERIHWQGIDIDNLYLDAEIVEESIRVRNGYVFVKDSKISGSGKYEFLTRKLHADCEYKLNFDSFYNFTKKHELKLDGLIEGKLSATGKLSKNDIYLNGFLNGHNIVSEYALLDEVYTKFSYNNKKLELKKSKGTINEGTFELLNNLSLDFSKNRAIQGRTSIQAKDLHMNDILFFLGDDFKLLKGKVSGKLNLSMASNADVLVDANNQDSMVVSNLSLRPTKTDILNLSTVKINKLEIKAGKKFEISTEGSIGKSSLDIKGKVVGKDVDFLAKVKQFELTSLGGQLSEIVKGHGDLEISVRGNEDVVVHAYSPHVNNLDIYGFKLIGKSEADIRYSINQGILYVDKIINIKSGAVNANGVVDIENEKIDLKLGLNQIDISNLKQSINPIWDNVKMYLTPIGGIFNGEVILNGKFSNIVTSLNVHSDKVSAFNEPLDSIALELSVDNDNLNVKNFFAKKNTSSLSANTIYNFKNGIEEISIISTPIKLTDLYRYRDLGLGYNGYFSVTINAKRDGSLKGTGSAYLTSTKVGNVTIGSSSVEFNFSGENLDFSTKLLDDDVSISGKVNMSKKYPKISLAYDVNMPNIKTALSFLSEHNSFNNELNGFAQLDGSLNYDFNNETPVSFLANVQQFHIINYGRGLTLREPTKIKVDKSKIDRLNFSLSGSGGKYQVVGTGDLDRKFEIIQDLDINLSYLTLLSGEIERVLGSIKGRGLIVGNVKSFDISHSFSTNNFGLKLKNVPLEIANARGVGAFRDNKIFINNLEGELGTGTFELSGYIRGSFPYPELFLSGEYNNVGYQVESRSMINTDGKLTMTGSGFPYLLKGNVYINGGLVENEFDDFKSTSEYNKSLNKYITQTKRGIPDLVNLDINLSVKETIRLRNKLADLLIAGDLSVQGQFTNPTYQGQLIIVPGLSKFKFRGNDFILSEGIVYFSRNDNLDPISLNLLANSTIGQYDIEMGISGSVEDISINLESNPYLSRDNIFSLLTLGVTSDFSQNLEDSQRSNLTTIGIGTFLVDQLNINEGLDSALGLKLSVLPEFSESSDSPIEEATKSEQSVRTATKLQITKKVNENVDLKFSNTFDSESNKQSINIDYSINEKLSIEGVFESESDTNNENDTEGSAGADIKYKWSF